MIEEPERIDLSPRVGELSHSEMSRWSDLRREPDRRRYLAAHLRLREVLGERLGIRPAQIRLGNDPCPICGSTEHGRPISEDDPESTHWSISHTDSLVAIAVSSEPVGVDVESAAKVTDTSFLDQVGIHPTDAGDLATIAAGDLDRARLARWSRLEAILKMTGAGLGVEPVSVIAGVTGHRVTDVVLPVTTVSASVVDLKVPDSHVGAVAVIGQDAPRIVTRS